MIYQSTLNTLTEEELSILYFILNNFFAPLGLEPKIDFLKMLRLSVVLPMLDILKPQALEINQIFFESLKNKLQAQ